MQRMITDDMDALLAILNDILDLSKIEAGKLSFENIAFDIRQVVNDIVVLHSLKSEQQGVSLLQQIDDSVPDYLMGDPTRLRIILACLQGPTSVGNIAQSLDLSASLVSHHLRLLRAARVMRGQRRGKQIYYAVADEHISCVIADMLEHVTEPPGQGGE